MPQTEEERLHEDLLARRRGRLFELWQGRRIHNADFHRYIMTLSIAGLGFNLTGGKPGMFEPSFLMLLWRFSTIFFLVAILLILLVFFLTAMLFRVQSRMHDPDEESASNDEKWDNRLPKLIGGSIFGGALFFLFAVSVATLRFLLS